MEFLKNQNLQLQNQLGGFEWQLQEKDEIIANLEQDLSTHASLNEGSEEDISVKLKQELITLKRTLSELEANCLLFKKQIEDLQQVILANFFSNLIFTYLICCEFNFLEFRFHDLFFHEIKFLEIHFRDFFCKFNFRQFDFYDYEFFEIRFRDFFPSFCEFDFLEILFRDFFFENLISRF